eukprot:TRINITY_DN29102_c0_g1_i2.p1 TRINITY_DN29102_c0_g1~~TRINITY_DN29102_c0_g1_i2.p1  ORF type:complete len:130 (+),score=3.03 TRINITY_DN29102_c0_g1_i2:91-480(+)
MSYIPRRLYARLPLVDNTNQPFLALARDGHDFITEALAADPEHRVVVHCARGGSRSAAVVIGHVMRSAPADDACRTYEGALALVKGIRSLVDPNDGFVMELRELETHLLLEAENACAGDSSNACVQESL